MNVMKDFVCFDMKKNVLDAVPVLGLKHLAASLIIHTCVTSVTHPALNLSLVNPVYTVNSPANCLSSSLQSLPAFFIIFGSTYSGLCCFSCRGLLTTDQTISFSVSLVLFEM